MTITIYPSSRTRNVASLRIAVILAIVLLTAGLRAPAYAETLRGMREAVQRGDVGEVNRLLGGSPAGQHEQEAATALIAAAFYGKTDLMESLLKGGVPATSADQRGWSALMSAVKGNQPAAVDLLLSRGADPDALPQGGGPSAAMLAASLGRTAMAERLRHGGPSGGRKSTTDVFTVAVQDGRLDAVKGCLAEPGFKVGGSIAQRALILAIQKNDAATATTLLERGASADEPATPAGATPLAVAAGNDRADIARLLLAHGANVARVPERGQTPLRVAIRAKAVETARLLIENGAPARERPNDGYLLFAVVGAQEPALVEPLLAAGVNVNFVADTGLTPLMWAVAHCREAVDPMLAHGARLDLRDHDGRTVFERPDGAWLADKMRQAGAGAQVDAVANQPRHDKAQLTAALLAAIKKGDAPAVRTLLDQGAAPRTCNKLGWPAFVLAASLGHTDIVRLLYERDPSTATQSSADGHWNGLHEAAGNGHMETVRFLLACRVDPEMPTDYGHTAADLAEMRDHADIAQLLRNLPAPDATNKTSAPPATP